MKAQTTLDHWIPPEWHGRAKCAQPAADPSDYDADWPPGHPRRDRAVNLAAAQELCEGCPVIAQCAAGALHYPRGCDGTIRAGYPLQFQSARTPNAMAGYLRAVAAGSPTIPALIATRPALEYLPRTLALLVALRRRG